VHGVPLVLIFFIKYLNNYNEIERITVTLVKNIAMKKLRYSVLFILSATFLTSCGGQEQKEETSKDEEEVCFYKYNEGSTVLEWTAFKFNEKAPVKGTFKEINFDGTLESDDAMTVLKSLSFDIPVSSVETQNEERNGKILEHFFGSIATENLTGKMVSLNENGEAIIEISMNNMAKQVKGTYTFVDGRFDFSGTMDVLDWNAGKGIDMLNKICKELHTGTDGVSKLWSTVDLSFSTILESDCD
jgi:YceI-like domain